MASTEPAGEDAKPVKKEPPALSGLFKPKAKKKPGVGKKKDEKPLDEWGGEPDADEAKAEVKVEVAALKKDDEDVDAQEVKGPIWKKKEGEEKDKKTGADYP